MKKRIEWFCFVFLFVMACEPKGEEPQEVTLPVSIDGRGLLLPTVNTGDWQVSVDTFDVCVENFEFTQEGEAHVSVLRRISNFLVPELMAHPGHLGGGDVTGVLDGAWVIRFMEKTIPLGDATLLEGAYNGFNMNFCIAGESHGITDEQPIFGHNAAISGVGKNGSQSVRFELFVDIADDPVLFGGIFEEGIAPSMQPGLRLKPVLQDSIGGGSFFDGIDFGLLDDDGDGFVSIEKGSEAHNILMKALMDHPYWSVTAEKQ